MSNGSLREKQRLGHDLLYISTFVGNIGHTAVFSGA